LLEVERIKELLGAAGNLHAVIFEILFKQQFLLKTPLMVEVFSVDASAATKRSYAKAFFDACRAKLTEKSAR
jgi:hypothetical protein